MYCQFEDLPTNYIKIGFSWRISC